MVVGFSRRRANLAYRRERTRPPPKPPKHLFKVLTIYHQLITKRGDEGTPPPAYVIRYIFLVMQTNTHTNYTRRPLAKMFVGERAVSQKFVIRDSDLFCSVFFKSLHSSSDHCCWDSKTRTTRLSTTRPICKLFRHTLLFFSACHR